MNTVATNKSPTWTNEGLYRHYVLLLLLLVGVCSWSDRQVFSIVLEAIRRDLNLSDTQLGLLGGTAFALFYAVVGIPIARIADRSSRRNIISAAVLLWSAMTALTATAKGYGAIFAYRVGLGVGEAGGSAPAQSMVADLYPPHQRALAMGVLFSNLPIGYLLSYALGGWLNDAVGWRTAFWIFGIPGVALAILLRFTAREPERTGVAFALPVSGASEASLARTIGSLLRLNAMPHICFAGAAHGLGMYAVAVWLPAFFIRVHSLSSSYVGVRLALIMGVGGIIGTLSGGRIADFLVAKTANPGWYSWMCAIGLILSLPLSITVFATHHANIALTLLCVPMALNNMIVGPTTASIQSIAGPKQRAVAAALYLVLSNLIAAGLGPLIIGAVSDALHAHYSTNSLRYALLLVVPVTAAWAAVHFFLAGRALRRSSYAE